MKSPISARLLSSRFGAQSQMFLSIREGLRFLWEKVQGQEAAQATIAPWSERMTPLYGHPLKDPLFLHHAYLTLLAKVIVYLRLEPNPNAHRLMEVISGEYFAERAIKNFPDEDPSLWLSDPKIRDAAFRLVCSLYEHLSLHDFSVVDEDIFANIYEEIVGRESRRKAGEYYTPKWLVELVLDEALSLWQPDESLQGKAVPTIADPACGSGVFLQHILLRFIKRGLPFKDILESVTGMDVHPVAVMMAKANYLLALGDWVRQTVSEINLPIHLKDSLQSSNLFTCQEVNRYDILVGNPPWAVMRSLERRYQDFLKEEALKYHLLNSEDVHLFTQMELATLFFCKCADLYLKKRGVVAFVMPRSVLAGTMHHANFRKFRHPPMRLHKVIDLERVEPLFNMPACVLIVVKDDVTSYPVPSEKYEGRLTERNIELLEARRMLRVTTHAYTPQDFPERLSDYYDKFKVGASIFPRSLYFVDVLSRGRQRLKVTTASGIYRMVKEPWQVVLEGHLEGHFLFSTILAWEIVPFGYLRLRAVVLPVEEEQNGYKLLDLGELRAKGFWGAAQWFEIAEGIWAQRRTSKSRERFESLLDRLNYNGLLTAQNPSKRYVVLYNATGANLVSCIVDKRSLESFDNFDNGVEPKGFIADVKTWFYETDGEMEAHYLSAVLNSETINQKIKPLQPRGLFGARAIHRRPLCFAIPQFDDRNGLHMELSEAGRVSQEKVKSLRLEQNKNKNVRAQVRERLRDEMKHINQIIARLLGEVW